METQDGAARASIVRVQIFILAERLPHGASKTQTGEVSVIKSRLRTEVLPWGDGFGYY